jgi:hypothetical protein
VVVRRDGHEGREGEDQEILTLTKTTAIYVPANLSHTPLNYTAWTSRSSTSPSA